jgi:hypothetical protein
MSCNNNKSNEFSLFTGVVIGGILGSTVMGLYNFSKYKYNKNNKTMHCVINDNDPDHVYNQSDNESDETKYQSDPIDQSNPIDQSVYLSENKNNIIADTINSVTSIDESILLNHHVDEQTISHHNCYAQCSHEIEQIKKIDTSPLELRKKFNNKGYVFVNQNLATLNTELNEFVELMKKYELHVLNGCDDPDNCSCNFRHKRCRLFMIRKYSNDPALQFFSPTCSGVRVISPSNDDIQNGTMIHEFIQMFTSNFLAKVMDLVHYVCYIIDSQKLSLKGTFNQYVVDITMIANPYDNSIQENLLEKDCYGKPSELIMPKNSEIDQHCINRKCTLSWHQDHFVEAKTNQTHAYDVVALFILNAINITPHKLLIGRLRSDVDTRDMTLDQIQEYIIPLAETTIDINNSSDLGYIIDQRKRYFHRHTDFEHIGQYSRRNAITIRIKYLE